MGHHEIRSASPLWRALAISVAVLAVAGCSALRPGPAATSESAPFEETAVDSTAVEAAVADSTATEEPTPIRVKISDEERAQLIAQLDADLQAATAQAASRPAASELSDEQRQRWDTLDQYIELAKTSLESEDVRAAADLARKARLLAAELAPR